MGTTLRTTLIVLATILVLADPVTAQRQARLAGRWLGQDGQDYVGPNSALAPSGVQDLHIRLMGLPANREVRHAVIRGLGGDEWQFNGPHGPWKAHLVRRQGATTADLFLEPTRVETGRGFTITLTFDDDRTAEIIVEGGKADPDLRMPQARLQARWVGQDGRDRVGSGPSVGPDGHQDACIELVRLSPDVEIQSATIQAPDGAIWEYGVNPKGLPNAELLRSGEERGRAELFFQPDKDRSGQTLRLRIGYANGKSDTTTVVAGKFDPRRAVARPPLPRFTQHQIKARWLGQDSNVVEMPGAVSISLDGRPPKPVAAAALSDPAGGLWVARARPDVAIDAGTYPGVLAWQDGPTPGRASIAFTPIRDETSATLTLRLLFADGTNALVPITGGTVDLARRSAPLAPTRSVARPGDDLHALTARGGTLTLSAGTYRLDRPLVLEQPIALVGEPGAELLFAQPGGAPPWTAAIKIHAGNTTLEGFGVRFAGAVRWDAGVAYGPAVIGSTDDRDEPHHDPKAAITLRRLDLEGPPPATRWEEAPRLVRLVTAAAGTIEGCRLRGGAIELVGGPWTISDNTHRGTHPGAFAFSVVSLHRSHDVVVRGNTTRADGPSGKTWRFLVLTVGGFKDQVLENTISDVGPRDDDAKPENAPEIILTESYKLRFEGAPRAISTDGHIIDIGEPQGDPAEPGDVLAVVAGPHAGTFVRIAQRIDRGTYLLDSALPKAAEVPAVSIVNNGFVDETFEGNRIDARGGAVAAGFVLAGNLFGTRVVGNSVQGCGEAIRIVASPTEHPGPWGWSHAPVFGLVVERNTLEGPRRGMTLAVEYGPPVKSSRDRVYLSGTLSENTIRHVAATAARNVEGQGGPAGFTIGDARAPDPGALVLEASGNRVEGPAGRVRDGALFVESGTVNGQVLRNKRVADSTRSRAPRR
jgi:hypothetical protein